MNEHEDRLSDALSPLAERNVSAEAIQKTKERVMKNSIGSAAAGSPRRRHMLAATLGLAVLGSAAFAAAGGVQAVKRWFVTVELDGKTYDLELVGENPSFKIEDTQLGEDVTITLESEDANTGGTMSVTATENEEGGVDVTTNTEAAPGDE